MQTLYMLKMRAFLNFSIFLFVGLTSLQGVVTAATMPDLVSLAPLTDRVNGPTDVAVDQQGQIYIAETAKNQITIFDQRGQFTGKVLTDVTDPVSVAVDNNGRILVGNGGNGSVAVFGADLAFLFKLGIGDGEFINPADIATDSAGNIYVADNPDHSISTYTVNGEQTGSIGSPGNDNGQLHHPTSIAIDSNTGEIVVLDHQQIFDNASGNMTDGARIQYFAMDGSPLRAYNKFGYNNGGMIKDPETGKYITIYDINMGEMTRPNQIAVDDKSRVYVTDARMQNIMVYDNSDNFLGTISSTTNPLRIPLGLTIGKSSRLYVASLLTRSVETFGVDDYTSFLTTPPLIELKVTENSNAPSFRTATISNLGNASFNWNASTPDSWVSLGATTGTLLEAETAFLDISVNPNGLSPGKYTSSVVVDTGAGAAETITLFLTVEPNHLQVAPGALNFETTQGSTPPGKQLTITSVADTSLLWNASADQQWITLSKTTGMTPESIRVYADIASLIPGTHNGTITCSQQGDNHHPVEIPVSLVLAESTTPPDDPPVSEGGGKNKWNKKWTTSRLLPGTALKGVAGTSKANVFAVGENGTILHFNGKDWTQMNADTAKTLNSVWCSSMNNGFAVGAEGLVLHYNGTEWTQRQPMGKNGLKDIWGSSDTHIVTAGEFGSILDSSFTNSANLGVALRSVWGSSENDIFATGEAGVIFHYDGSNWTPMAADSTEWLNGIWGNPSSGFFAVGENGTIIQLDTTTWAAMDSGTTLALNGICGFSGEDIYAVGDNSLILHYNGSEWGAMDAGAEVDLNDIWCSGKGDIFVVGDDGTIIHGKGLKFPWLMMIQELTSNVVKKKKEEVKNK